MDWIAVAMLAIGTGLGSASTLVVTLVQQRAARKEREAAADERRIERVEQRLLAERDRLHGIYKRMSQIAREYCALEDSQDRAVRWKEFRRGCTRFRRTSTSTAAPRFGNPSWTI